MKLLSIIGMTSCCLNACALHNAPELVCTNREAIIDSVRETFNADTVLLYPKLLQEEAYLPEIRAITLCLVNGTTKSLDFKTLDLVKYNRYNDGEMEQALKKEAIDIAHLLYKNCNIEDFNDIIIEFFKYGDDGLPHFRYICHYHDEFYPEEK